MSKYIDQAGLEALCQKIKSYFLQVDDITTGSTNGAISVNGTDVWVKGLQFGAFATTYAGSDSAGGAATSAVALNTARTIDGVDFDGSANIIHYGSSSTAAATQAKVVACTGFKLVTGAIIFVKFTVTNTKASPQLNVNSTGAKAIYYRGAAVAAGTLTANRVYCFVYDGTYYQLIGDVNTDADVTATKITFPSSSTNYYLTASSSDATATEGISKFGTDARIQVQAGTTSAEGRVEVILGNATASGTAGNTSGVLCLYNNKGKYTEVKGHAGDTTNRILYMPKTGGTLVAHTTDTKIGDTNKPVYVTADGVATAISYTIDKSVPSDAVFTDTNNAVTNTLGTTTKFYVTGTTSSTTTTGGQYFDTGVYVSTTAGNLYATTFNTGGNITMGGTANTDYLQLPSGIKLY